MHLPETFVAFVKSYSSFEPAYFLFFLAQGFSDLASVNLYLQKACRNQTQWEPNLSTPCDNERNGIEFVASINSRYSLLNSFITLTTCVLISAWSDRAPNRPKSAILILMLFRLLQLISMCCQAYFWHWPALAAFFTECLLSSGPCVRVASIIYACSTSSMQDRTFKLTLLFVFQLLSYIISSGTSGYLLHHLGFFYSYILCLILHAISLVYAVIFMKPSTSDDTDKHTGFIKSIREFFDIRSVLQAFRLVFGKRDGNERIAIILLSVINVLSYFTFLGELSVLYLYLRYRFAWDEKDYGIYGLYKIVGVSVGSMICLGISKYMKVADSALGMFAAFWDTLASLGYFFAAENWQLYLVPLFDIFHGFAITVCDSTQSKFFKNEEFGRLFSAHVAVGILATFSVPVYSFLFTKTMDFLPASIFILSTSINVIICILYGICYLLIKKMPKID